MKLKTIFDAVAKRLDIVFVLMAEIEKMQDENDKLLVFGVDLKNDIDAKRNDFVIATKKYSRIYVAFYKRILIADFASVTPAEFSAFMELYKGNAVRNNIDTLSIDTFK